MMTTIYIKNMVCNRCIMAVDGLMRKLGLHVTGVNLGEAVLDEEPTDEQMELLRTELTAWGFEMIDDKRARLIEKIKNIIVNQVHHQGIDPKNNLSDILSNSLAHDYAFLSKLFSEVEGITIEKYYIAQKIEKVKELLVYDELSLSEIAFQLNYSSVAYLSNQFKKVTGLSPSHFKKMKEGRRKPIDKL